MRQLIHRCSFIENITLSLRILKIHISTTRETNMDNYFMTTHKTSYHSSLMQEPQEIILLDVHQAGNLRDIKLIIFYVFNLLIYLVKKTDFFFKWIHSAFFLEHTGLLS